jgi:hypothetical protein
VSGRQRLALAAAFVVAAALAVGLAGSRGSSRGSAVSRGPGGWLAARRYLQARGARVTLITEPLGRWVEREQERRLEGARPGRPGAAPIGGERGSQRGGEHGAEHAGNRGGERSAERGADRGAGVLVLAFPWQGTPTVDLDDAIDAHLEAGGDLLFAYSGEEAGAEHLLGLWRGRRARSVPLAPWRWRAFVRREWDLRPAGGEGRPPVRIWAPRELPEIGPGGARVLFTSPGGQPAAAVVRHHGGRVVLLPADALANARLGEAGNADLLESLRASLGNRWAFDEYHHGLVTTEPVDARLGRAADLLAAHLVLLYLLAVLALARRQGPAWREPVPLSGSAATFLLGLGALHHRLGHHRDAARLLLRRARELDRGLMLPAELDWQAETAGPRELVTIAREVARRRGGLA